MDEHKDDQTRIDMAMLPLTFRSWLWRTQHSNPERFDETQRKLRQDKIITATKSPMVFHIELDDGRWIRNCKRPLGNS
jgi:hypothetical protein